MNLIKTMKRELVLLSSLVLLAAAMLFTATALTSCATHKNAAGTAYTELRNYFIRNDAPQTIPAVITTGKDFDRYFSPAAYMGKGGEPTKTDFSRSFVIAVALPETDVETTIKPGCLTTEGDKLVLGYTVSRGRKQSYTIRPLLLISVPGELKGRKVEIKPL